MRVVQIESKSHAGSQFLGGKLHRLFLPHHGIRKISRFGVGGGQGFENADVLPVAQLRPLCRVFDSFLPVTVFRIGASGFQQGSGTPRRILGRMRTASP